MEQSRFEMQWPREHLAVNCYTHQVTNFHYHRHPEEYELNILLHGNQDFCRETKTWMLEADDVLLVGPGEGHASFAQNANTRALVLHFPAKVFKDYLKKGYVFEFQDCRSNAEKRNETRYRLLRFYAAQIFEALSEGGEYAALKAKGSLELLLAVLCSEFEPKLVETEKNLAEIALEHGFADLKSFHKRFKETFHRTPAKYRSQLTDRYVLKGEQDRIYVKPSDELVQEKIRGYLIK